MGDYANARTRLTAAPHPQMGNAKQPSEASSSDSISKNAESVQMVSEGGKMVPRIIPSVKQIEKTKPRRLNDSAFKPSEDSSSSAQSSAEKTGGRRGRSGGVGWRKDAEENERKEPEFRPKNDKFPPHGITNDAIYRKESRGSAGRSRDGLTSIVEEGNSRGEERLKSFSSGDGKFSADSVSEPVNTSTKSRPPVNYVELRKEIEDLKAEMNELRAAKRSRSDSVENSRLQPLSSQPLSAQGLVSPTFRNNVSNNPRNQRKSVTESMDSDNKPVYNVKSQARDAKPPAGNPGPSLQNSQVGRPGTKESMAGNSLGSSIDSKTAPVRDAKYGFPNRGGQNAGGSREFGNRSHSGENISENSEAKSKSRLDPKAPVGGNPQRFNQSLNRSSRWPANGLTTPLHVAARRRKAMAQRRSNAGRNPNASDNATEIAWKKKDQKPREGCAQLALRRMMTARSSSFILLPFHCILVAFLLLYLMVGALIIVKGSEGRVGAWHWKAVSGDPDAADDQPVSLQDPPGRAAVRKEVLEKVMDMAVEAVLVRSKREVLKNIFYSPDMQAAFRAHQETGYQTLPSDDTIKAISDDITRRWRDDLSAVLARNDFIADLYTLGYQISVKEMFDFLSPYSPLPAGISWDHPSAILHAFSLVSTIGGGARTGGSIRGFVVAYTIVGVALYYWTVNVWSRRITDTLIRLSHICSTSAREDGPQARESREQQARALALCFSLMLVLGVWLGLCPVGMGTPRASYGERLESATMALLLVRPPYPLPQSMEAVAIFASCIAGSHCLLLSLLAQITVAFERWALRWLRSGSG